MIIYCETKEKFINDVEYGTDDGTIADTLKKTIMENLPTADISDNEYDSWVKSLPEMRKILDDPDIPSDAGIALEYNIPTTSCRPDFMISGYDNNKNKNVIIVELKQWSWVKKVPGEFGVVLTHTGNVDQKVRHPSCQAMTYAMTLEDFFKSVRDDHIIITPCAYLHNYILNNNDPLTDEIYSTYIEKAPVFTKDDSSAFTEFIKEHIQSGDPGQEIIHEIEDSEIELSKRLQDVVGNILTGKPEFILSDEQTEIYEKLLDGALKSKSDKKRVFIVEGGPGTGKSVIALNLLSALIKRGQFCQYISKNAAPRNCYEKKLAGVKIEKNPDIDKLFTGSGGFAETKSDPRDTLIVDEAHRLNEKSGYNGRVGENQIKEIINAANCSIFFIDEHQRVTFQDIGTIKGIEYWAGKFGAELTELKLTSQFRCNGSDGYIDWLYNVLEIDDPIEVHLDPDSYDFRIVDDPEKLYGIIKDKNSSSKNDARLVAGYCWDWDYKNSNDKDYKDINLGNLQISWNLNNSTTPYAIDKNSVEQAGCIYTVQGLEFDYVGVIIGDDLRYENGHVVPHIEDRAKTDRTRKDWDYWHKKNTATPANKQLADEIVRNTYYVLMSRGMKGCYVYCTDHDLADHLQNSWEKATGKK